MFSKRKIGFYAWIILGIISSAVFAMVLIHYQRYKSIEVLTNDYLSSNRVYFTLSGVEDPSDILNMCKALPDGSSLYYIVHDELWAGYGIENGHWPIISGKVITNEQSLSPNPVALLEEGLLIENDVAGSSMIVLGVSEYSVNGIFSSTYSQRDYSHRAIINIGFGLLTYGANGKYVVDFPNYLSKQTLSVIDHEVLQNKWSYSVLHIPNVGTERIYHANEYLDVLLGYLVVCGSLCLFLGLVLLKNDLVRRIYTNLLIGKNAIDTLFDFMIEYTLPFVVAFVLSYYSLMIISGSIDLIAITGIHLFIFLLCMTITFSCYYLILYYCTIRKIGYDMS